MHCTQYEKYEKGDLSQSVFERHLKECGQCQQEINADKIVLTLAASLDNMENTPNLWPEIRHKIETKQSVFRLQPFPTHFIKIAAAILIAVSTIVFFNYKPDLDNASILSSSALLEVERREDEYMRAIEQLEKIASQRTESFDINLALLYRDKLETIDSQIERCRDALKLNPANTHIRRYLLAALDDKKETLQDILQ